MVRNGGFKESVTKCWESFFVNGRPGYILVEKLKMLKVKLKEWSKNKRGNWKQGKEDTLKQYQMGTIKEHRATH